MAPVGDHQVGAVVGLTRQNGASATAHAGCDNASTRVGVLGWTSRADPGGCPCQTIASSPGPLTPFDVDAGRIVAGGDNATWLLDANGTRLLTLPVPPRAAQLSGNDLVVLVPGELRDYDARSGGELHAWPLPDVSSGPECATPNQIRCSSRPRLMLDDAARGLASTFSTGRSICSVSRTARTRSSAWGA